MIFSVMKDCVQESKVCVMQGCKDWPTNRSCGCSEGCTSGNPEKCPPTHHTLFSGTFKVCVRGIVGFNDEGLEKAYKVLDNMNVDTSQVITVFTSFGLGVDGQKQIDAEDSLYKTLRLSENGYMFSCTPAIYAVTCYPNADKREIFRSFCERDQGFFATDALRKLSKEVRKPGDLYSLYCSFGGDTMGTYFKAKNHDKHTFIPMLHCLLEMMDFIIYACGPHNVVHLDLHENNMVYKIVDGQYVPCLIDWDTGLKYTDMMVYIMRFFLPVFMQDRVFAQFPIEILLYTIGVRILECCIHNKSIKKGAACWRNPENQAKNKDCVQQIVDDLQHYKFDSNLYGVQQYFLHASHFTLVDHLSLYTQFTHEQKATKLLSVIHKCCDDPDFYDLVMQQRDSKAIQKTFESIFVHKKSRNMLYDLQSIVRVVGRLVSEYKSEVHLLLSATTTDIILEKLTEMTDPKNSVQDIRVKFTQICEMVEYDRKTRKNCTKRKTHKPTLPTLCKHRAEQQNENLPEMFACCECP